MFEQIALYPTMLKQLVSKPMKNILYQIGSISWQYQTQQFFPELFDNELISPDSPTSLINYGNGTAIRFPEAILGMNSNYLHEPGSQSNDLNLRNAVSTERLLFYQLLKAFMIQRLTGKDAIEQQQQPQTIQILYIQRLKTRTVLNEHQIVSILEALKQNVPGVDYKVVALENMNRAEQSRAFMNSTIIAGITGAGMANMIFAPRGGALAILIPNEKTIFFKLLCRVLGIMYTERYCEGICHPSVANDERNKNLDPNHRNSYWDPEQFKNQLIEAFQSQLNLKYAQSFNAIKFLRNLKFSFNSTNIQLY